MLVNVAHGENYSLLEHNDAMDHIYEKVGEENNPNIIVGDITDPSLGDKVCITIIATGCGGSSKEFQKPANRTMVGQLPQDFIPRPTVQTNMVAPESFGAFDARNVAPTMAAPAVQPATPRPTSVNFFALSQTQAQPQPQPQPQPEMTTSIPSVTETQVMASVQSAFSAPDFSSPKFDAKLPAEEKVVAHGSDTAEFSAVADEDRMNGGRGGVETNTFGSYETASFTAQNEYDLPAFARQEKAAKELAMAASARNESESEQVVDYLQPAWLRNAQGSMNNF